MTTPDYRAALAQMLKAAEFYTGWDSDEMDEAMDRARTLLAAPEAVGVTDEELFNVMSARGERGANSKMLWLQEDDFVPTARELLTRYGTTHPAPVPVGSSLWRQEGWCDTEGYCWAFFNRRWELWEPACLDATVLLLPHWALPLPEAQP